jgi:RiboL-PSP-HEPN
MVELRKPGTSAWRVFLRNLKRARLFVEFFDDARDRGLRDEQSQELLRSAIVFSISALDAYLHDLIVEVVCGYPLTDGLRSGLGKLAKHNPELALRVALAPDQASRQEEFRQGLEEWLSGRSLQGPRKVDEALGYVGCPIRWSDFDAATGRTDSGGALQRLTQQRHDLVHQADDLPITREEVTSGLDLIEAIGTRIDQQVCRRYGIFSP